MTHGKIDSHTGEAGFDEVMVPAPSTASNEALSTFQRAVDRVRSIPGVYLTREDAAKVVRAALGAVREPGDRLIAAGVVGDPLGCDVEESDYRSVYGNIWRAMIDALTAEG